MLRLAFDFIITWRETRTRPHAYVMNNAFEKTTVLPKCDKGSAYSTQINLSF